MMEPGIIVIVGPTASGKSDLAVSIAKKVNGEIISADSRQVYRGMNLGTGKITKKEMKGVPHHLLDVINPWNTFSVSRYKKMGRKTIENIIQRNRAPIICGGTGHYIEALIEGLVIPKVKPDKKMRRLLEGKTTKELFAILKKLDLERSRTIDQNNPRRLVRAIEIATYLGHVPQKQYDPLPYKTLWVGISKNTNELKERIHIRLLSRIKKGMIKEIQDLHNGKLGKSVSWKKLDDFGLEYRYISRYLQGLLTKEEMIVQLEKEIIAFSKRQNTWFKRNKSIHWIRGIDELYKVQNLELKNQN